jgi:hypothetical protein
MSDEPEEIRAAARRPGLWAAFRTGLFDWDPLDLVIRLTLVLLLLYAGSEWYERVLMVEFALCALVVPTLAREPKYWFAVFIVRLLVINLYRWPYTDNHHYLITYWCLALGVAFSSERPQHVAAINGRLLLGLGFLFAVAWKLTSWQYLEGTMFHFLLYESPRFAEISRMFGEFERVVGQPGESATQYMLELQPAIQLGRGPHFALLAQALTWWTLAVEAAIAIWFLSAPTGSKSPGRHVALLTFIITTYPFAEVISFAWILIILALADCPLALKKIRITYLALFVLLASLSAGRLKQVVFEAISSSM